MKKIVTKGLVTLILIALCACLLISCTDNKTEPITAEQIVFELNDSRVKVIFTAAESSETVYEGEYSGAYLDDLIFYLSGKGILTAESSDSGYGTFFTAVGDLVQDAEKGHYIYIFTDISDYIDVTEWASTVTYNGAVLTNASLGASALPLSDGAVYLITLVKF